MSKHPKPTHVYLVEFDGQHKIGCSADPEARACQVTPDPSCTSLLHRIESANAHQVERAIQVRFAARQIPGMGREWFRLLPCHVEAFRAVSRIDVPDDIPPLLLAEECEDVAPASEALAAFYRRQVERQKPKAGYVSLTITIPADLAEEMYALADELMHSIRDEVVMAFRRHVASPPRIVYQEDAD